jgi:hypothetical protein
VVAMCYGLESDRELQKKIKNVKTVVIKDINLLYKLADKNLLGFLLNVTNDWDNPNKKVWIFEWNSYVQDEITEFYYYKKRKR